MKYTIFQFTLYTFKLKMHCKERGCCWNKTQNTTCEEHKKCEKDFETKKKIHLINLWWALGKGTLWWEWYYMSSLPTPNFWWLCIMLEFFWNSIFIVVLKDLVNWSSIKIMVDCRDPSFYSDFLIWLIKNIELFIFGHSSTDLIVWNNLLTWLAVLPPSVILIRHLICLLDISGKYTTADNFCYLCQI